MLPIFSQQFKLATVTRKSLNQTKNSVVILGAGINGVLSAYFLAKAGLKVTVLDKAATAGCGASYANGGQLSFSSGHPFFASVSLSKILQTAFWHSTFPNFHNLTDRDFLSWLKKIIINQRNENVDRITRNLLTIGLASKSYLAEILEDETISFNHKEKGVLYFYRDKQFLDRAIKSAKSQAIDGCRFDVLSAQQCVRKEPTLVKLFDDKNLAGGLLFNEEGSGNCHKFLSALSEICRKKYGVNFEYNVEIRNILTNHQKVTGINTTKGVFSGGNYIFALGSYGNILLQGIGIDLGIYPVKGYSISIPTGHNFLAPNQAMTDSKLKIVYSRMGNIFRVGGTFEFDNLTTRINHKHIEFLKNAVRSTFSDFGDLNSATEWCGFRPYSANSLPIIGASEHFSNLFLNTGQGSLGWTNAFASAKFIADSLVTERPNQQLATIFRESMKENLQKR